MPARPEDAALRWVPLHAATKRRVSEISLEIKRLERERSSIVTAVLEERGITGDVELVEIRDGVLGLRLEQSSAQGEPS